MNYSAQTNSLITGSWDRTLRFWDPRSSSSRQQQQQQSSHDVAERVYHMDLVDNMLVVAMASRLFNIFDIRQMEAPVQERESSLKFMTRSLACMVDGQGAVNFDSPTYLIYHDAHTHTGYASASTEGRIAVEYFDPSPAAQEKKYAFKCHRQTIDDVDHVWPVNALAFHPV